MTREKNDCRMGGEDELAVVRLKDITWGGKIRVQYKDAAWAIAAAASREFETRYSGSVLSSEVVSEHSFLDGGVTDARGYWNSGGMSWHGRHAIAYILYELGLDPCKLLRRKNLPSHKELRAQVKEDKRRTADESEDVGPVGRLA